MPCVRDRIAVRSRSLLLVATFTALWSLSAQAGDVASRLQAAAKSSGGTISVDEWLTDAAGEPIWLARVGPQSATAGAVLIVAGLDGRHELGTELALRHVEALAAARGEDPRAGRTIYVAPDLTPSANLSRQRSPQRNRATSPGQSDTDRDGLVGEDAADDLDRDGVIRQLRVFDRDGEYVVSSSERSLLQRADVARDEVGQWRLLQEGRDDDKDLAWNEEEDSGVWLARNFPHGYEWFERSRGLHQVSEPETRAVADFLADHPEVGFVLIYGFEDNLLTAWPVGKSSSTSLTASRFGRTPPKDPHELDLPWVRQLSEKYHEALGVPEKSGNVGFAASDVVPEHAHPLPDATAAAAGGLGSYVYYQRGRLALMTPGWTPALQLAWNKAEDAAAKKSAEESPEEGDAEDSPGQEQAEDSPEEKGEAVESPEEEQRADRDEPDQDSGDPDGESSEKEDLPESTQNEEAYLTWLLERDSNAWKGWSPLEHPDFPDVEVFVGGYAPHAEANPPATEFDSLAVRHHEFFLDLLERLPRVRLREASLQSLGDRVYELTFVVENVGALPDVLAQGVVSAVVRPTRFELSLPSGAEVLGSPARAALDRLDGHGGAAERTLLLRMPQPGSVKIEVISEFAGRDEETIRPGQTWRTDR